MSTVTRRDFVRTAALATAAAKFVSTATAQTAPGRSSPTMPRATAAGAAPVRWLDDAAPAVFGGTTWGVSWPQGRHPATARFALTSAEGAAAPVQSWPLAYWPDGSLKWTAHAAPADVPLSGHYELAAGTPASPNRPLNTRITAEGIFVDTGVIQAHIAQQGDVLVPALTRGGETIAQAGRLVCLLEDRSAPGTTREKAFAGRIDAVTLESDGPVRAVVKIEGRHADAKRTWLPFVVRLYFYAGGDTVRAMHTITFDGDEDHDFIKGLGLRFDVPLRGELYDRHVRFAGQDDGLFGEAVRGLTGLRRFPGREVTAAQVAGEATPPLADWQQNVVERLQYIPAYDEWTLSQPNADGFQIRKRTQAGYTWLTSAQGQRAGGSGYIGTPQGGLAFGLRNFWQSYPAQLDIRGATTAAATVTVWMWAPEAPAMDLRSYHDGLGQDTYEKQYNGGLNITYEDYEPGFDTPAGVARTSELFFTVCAATPSRERLAELAAAVREPAVLTTTPEHLHASRVFGDIWTPVDRSTPARTAIEDKLDWYFEFYRDQQEQRRWYGYWNYGDVMHTYDSDRHEWRYDIGGFAWDNSELATDIWLWMQFLRSGRADLFRFAEAMTRHTGEVDVHHIGKFAPLGSRHNVLHWGCSAKQLRISTAVNRRYYYYLTGDERVGDLMRAQVEAGRALLRVPPTRKLASAEVAGDLARAESKDQDNVGLGFGTDWGSLAGAWLTEWERTGSELMKQRLLNGMRSIGAQPHGFFSAGVTMNLNTGEFSIAAPDEIGLSHLNAVFGLVEVCAELIQNFDVPEFRQAWLDYCELYSADRTTQEARLGQGLRGNSLRQGHSRLTAYAAVKLDRDDLAARAWDEFKGNNRWETFEPSRRELTGPDVLRPVEEGPGVSTNSTNQWSLAAIECLALIGRSAPKS
ncbi:Tat pathway signal sequence domain protein [Synoicihabitans lomoniglobus]|uniref:Tat pathway signal sequence domain protein n=1 Tax=Synoicihabitans lomoniglobus TaxID=2909285 RepID=A0AAE9ZS63_9BACT|nr:Tat pathway signal sequence domain protein [Opitutaceae bacterium LMO-M01]WED64245.1 Tat pathway signal sequence domain protein [Opitutaceae bacterium LMO-M01]